MINFHAAAAELVAVLAAAGVPAALDIRDLNLPGVLIPPPDLAWRFGKASADATWRIIAAAGNTGRDPALAALADLIGQVTAALGGIITAARPVDLAVGDGGGPMPAYELTFTTRLADEDYTP